MTAEVDIDVQVLKSEIKKTYASVSEEPEKDSIFPTGRSWPKTLTIRKLANVPDRRRLVRGGCEPVAAASARAW